MDPLLNLSIIRKNMLIVEFLKTIKNSKIYRKYLEGTIEIENVNDYLVISKYYTDFSFKAVSNNYLLKNKYKNEVFFKRA